MITNLKKEDLIAFEDEIAKLYEEGKIRSPIHLRTGNEDKLIEIFKSIRSNDRVCCSWASHLECLLKGVSQEEIKKAVRRAGYLAKTVEFE